jgi:cytochrome c-type biogenesis protein CcmE
MAANTNLIGTDPLYLKGPDEDPGALFDDLGGGPCGRIGPGMDPSRKRAIRLTVALTAALLLASALIYTSFAAGRDEVTVSQLLQKATPGKSYILAGTVLAHSVRHEGSTLVFRVRDPKLKVSVPVRYTGIVPDPFAEGRGVLVTVREQGSTWIGEQNSLTTKCPSKYQAASSSY